MSWLVSLLPGGSGGGAVLAVLNVLDRDFQKPILETENGLVTRNRRDPCRTRIADDLGRIVVDQAATEVTFSIIDPNGMMFVGSVNKET
ncbi:MAG: hypothetical protein VR71_11855 [Roseovarius sp. BRH_c41]|nr:MAG: hypothetical protein VR71_11855 [Roseovarius sp. BRH_c41]